MRCFSNKSWLTGSAVCAGLLIGGNLLPAWQEGKTGSRPSRSLEGADVDDRPDRGDGFVTLHKCRVKLIHNITLAADRPGVISYVEPEEGDSVKSGQEIIGLKDEAAKAAYKVALEKAESDVNIRFAKASADVAKAEWDKIIEANKRVPGTVPVVEVERARLNFVKGMLQGEHAEHEQKIAKLEVEKAAEELKSLKVIAPFDGKVRRIHKRPGEAVTQGAPILDLVSTSRVKIEGLLPIEDLGNVEAGNDVEVKVEVKLPGQLLPIEGETFYGKVIFIDPTLSPVNQSARVWAEVENPGERLIEGLPAAMKIKHGKKKAGGNAAGKPRANGIRQTSGTN